MRFPRSGQSPQLFCQVSGLFVSATECSCGDGSPKLAGSEIRVAGHLGPVRENESREQKGGGNRPPTKKCGYHAQARITGVYLPGERSWPFRRFSTRRRPDCGAAVKAG